MMLARRTGPAARRWQTIRPTRPSPGRMRGQMDGLAVEALGGEQLHGAVGARDVKRAHLGDHVGGDEHDDAVQARLCGDRLRHDFAEPPQQQSRSARRAHQTVLLVAGRVGRPIELCNDHAGGKPLPGMRFPPVSSISLGGIETKCGARQDQTAASSGEAAQGARSRALKSSQLRSRAPLKPRRASRGRISGTEDISFSV